MARWTNRTDALHTVTSDTGAELDSTTIAATKTFTHTFSAAGTFAYHCQIHPYAVANVVVLAAGVTLPSTDASPIVGSNGDHQIGLFVVVLAGLAGQVLRSDVSDRPPEAHRPSAPRL